MSLPIRSLFCLLCFLVPMDAPGKTITQIIDAAATGESGVTLDRAESIVIDDAGNAFVAGNVSNNVFKIEPDGTITRVLDQSGDGTNAMEGPADLDIDASGSLYIAAFGTSNAFRLDPDGTVTQLIDATGNGAAALDSAQGIAVSGSGNVYVAANVTQTVFRIEPDGTTSAIAYGGPLVGVVVDTQEVVYTARQDDPFIAWKADAGSCVVTDFPTIDGGSWPVLDDANRAYLNGSNSDNAVRVERSGSSILDPDGCATPVVTELIGAAGDGANPLDSASGIAVDRWRNVYVTGELSDNVFRIAADGTITQVMDASGDGTHALDAPSHVEVDRYGNVYVTGRESDNAFKITFCGDGALDPGEACDDGNNLDGDGCPAACRPVCGNGSVEGPEQCDDGGQVGGDGCSASCFVETEQTKEQQSCIRVLDGGHFKVAKVKGKETVGCVKRGSKEELAEGETIELCVDADSKGKVAKAKEKTVKTSGKKCAEEGDPGEPGYGATDPDTVNEGAEEAPVDVLTDIFGPDLDRIALESEDPELAMCHQKATQGIELCRRMIEAQFRICVARGMRARRFSSRLPPGASIPFGSPEDHAACFLYDSRGSIARVCSASHGVLRRTLDRHCGSVDPATAFAGCPAADTQGMAECMQGRIQCHTCLEANEAKGLSMDCDLLDDGDGGNSSCF